MLVLGMASLANAGAIMTVPSGGLENVDFDVVISGTGLAPAVIFDLFAGTTHCEKKGQGYRKDKQAIDNKGNVVVLFKHWVDEQLPDVWGETHGSKIVSCGEDIFVDVLVEQKQWSAWQQGDEAQIQDKGISSIWGVLEQAVWIEEDKYGIYTQQDEDAWNHRAKREEIYQNDYGDR